MTISFSGTETCDFDSFGSFCRSDVSFLFRGIKSWGSTDGLSDAKRWNAVCDMQPREDRRRPQVSKKNTRQTSKAVSGQRDAAISTTAGILPSSTMLYERSVGCYLQMGAANAGEADMSIFYRRGILSRSDSLPWEEGLQCEWNAEKVKRWSSRRRLFSVD